MVPNHIMAFVRIKKIKEWHYGYLVENKWKAGGARQRVKAYLGRVYPLENVKNIEVEVEIAKDYKQAIRDLVKFELLKKGFTEKDKTLVKDKLTVDLENNTCTAQDKNIVLKMNDGHLCTTTFGELLDFRAYGNEEEGAVRLAEKLVQAGLSIPEEAFVALFIEKFKPELPTIEEKKSFI